jgi:hypothetical protein
MKIYELPFAVLRFQYQLARFPLQLIEDRVVARLDAEAPARLFYERSIGALDATVGNVLGDATLEKRGAALVERGNALSRAAELDATAEQTQRRADANVKAARERASEEQKQAHAAKESEVEEARNAAEDRKRAAVETAQKRNAAVIKQADEVAAQRVESVETAKRREEAVIGATERSAAAAAASKLDDAQDKRGQAAKKRAQANKVEQLADTEKTKRKAERAKD